jgi:hypothetical protein
MNRMGVFVVAGALLISGCGARAEGDASEVGESSAALGADVTETVPVTYVCSPSQAFRLVFEVTHPATVAPAAVFPITLDVVNFFPPTVAPQSGNWTSSQEVVAGAASPVSQSVDFGTFHFAAGQILANLGSATATLTAASAGGPVVVDAGAFDYNVAWDAGGGFVNQCEPPEGEPPLATIPIVNEPKTKDDCKNGGWQTHTDAAGNPFKNQGRCVSYVNH